MKLMCRWNWLASVDCTIYPDYNPPDATLSSHQVTCNSDTACRGNLNLNTVSPFAMRTIAASPIVASRPALSSLAYCSGVGDCGEPRRFHAAKALLLFSSMRKCSNLAVPFANGREASFNSTAASDPATSSSW